MTVLHVIYRVDDEGTSDELWTTYSFPEGIYVSGDTLQRARYAFHQAAQVHFTADEFAELELAEHIERPIIDNVYVRVAVDQLNLDRQDVARALTGTLTTAPDAPQARADFAGSMWSTMAGELVVVACVARDSIRWVLDQTSALDTIGVCNAGPSIPGAGTLVWWVPLVREGAAAMAPSAYSPEMESLADGGLEIDSTVGELLTAKRSQGERPTPILIGATTS